MPASTSPPPGMVLIPGGLYLMGCHDDPLGCYPYEMSPHIVAVSSFYISPYEVTSRQYVDYLNSAYEQNLIEVYQASVRSRDLGYETYCSLGTTYDSITWDGSAFIIPGHDLWPGDERNLTQHPVVEVTWYGAAAYCNWLSVRDGRQPYYDPWVHLDV